MLGLLSWVASLALAASPAIVVEGTSLCPTPEAVSEQLRNLEGVGSTSERPAGPQVSAELDHVDDAVRLRLRRDEETLAERRLAPGPPCQTLAMAAAVIITSWEAELASGVLLSPGIQPPPPPLPPPPPVVPRPAGLLRYEVGLSFLAAVDGSGFAPGGMLEGSLGLGRSPFWARLALSATGTHNDRVGGAAGGGDLGWMRAALSLGPRYVQAVGGWRLEGHFAGVVALLSASSNGLPESTHVLDVDPGLIGGLRVTRRLGRGLGVFAGTSVMGWLNTQRFSLRVANSSSTVDLPRVEGWLSLGLSYGRD